MDDEVGEIKFGGVIKSVDEMLELIDFGGSKGGVNGRIWIIDFIDGIKGFFCGG